MKEVTLPSGAILKISVAPLVDARELYQAVLDEFKSVKIEGQYQLDYNFLKDLVCSGFTSKRIERAIEKCWVKSLYNDRNISISTWEPVEARCDYVEACFEIAKENILPFTKNLSQGFVPQLVAIINGLLSTSQRTPS